MRGFIDGLLSKLFSSLMFGSLFGVVVLASLFALAHGDLKAPSRMFLIWFGAVVIVGALPYLLERMCGPSQNDEPP